MFKKSDEQRKKVFKKFTENIYAQIQVQKWPTYIQLELVVAEKLKTWRFLEERRTWLSNRFYSELYPFVAGR